MTGKAKSRNWDDIKMVIAAFSVTGTLVLWNIFAAGAKQEESDQVAEQLPEPTVMEQVLLPTAIPTQPSFTGKILLGGTAPQPRVITRSGGGGGQGSGPVTQTRSS